MFQHSRNTRRLTAEVIKAQEEFVANEGKLLPQKTAFCVDHSVTEIIEDANDFKKIGEKSFEVKNYILSMNHLAESCAAFEKLLFDNDSRYLHISDNKRKEHFSFNPNQAVPAEEITFVITDKGNGYEIDHSKTERSFCMVTNIKNYDEKTFPNMANEIKDAPEFMDAMLNALKKERKADYSFKSYVNCVVRLSDQAVEQDMISKGLKPVYSTNKPISETASRKFLTTDKSEFDNPKFSYNKPFRSNHSRMNHYVSSAIADETVLQEYLDERNSRAIRAGEVVPEKPKIAPVEKDNESGKWWVGIFEKHKEESATAKVNFESAAKDPNLAWALKAFNIDEHGKPLDPDKEGKSKQ